MDDPQTWSECASPRRALDLAFWRIILATWTFGELDVLASYARDVELCQGSH